MEKVVDTHWKDKGAKLSAAQAKGRYDIKVLSAAGQHVIVELKKSGSPGMIVGEVTRARVRVGV